MGGAFPSIGDYQVIELLGAGGMGEVYLVEHPRLPRRDALKLLDIKVSRNQEFRNRFKREADVLAHLRHPNIITIYDRGEHDGRLWLTMEYVDGEDAAKLVAARGPLPAELAIRIIADAGAALDYAYRKHQITHRDVKPANILVEFSDGRVDAVKLADFGIAKAAGESVSLTSTGVAIGTMAYISPEAIEGRQLDNKADLYSLACTAFELLTGTQPYPADTIPALMLAHISQPIPGIAQRNQSLPDGLNAVFAKALAKRPIDRYATCAEFIDALRIVISDQASSASGFSPNAAERRPAVWSVGYESPQEEMQAVGAPTSYPATEAGAVSHVGIGAISPHLGSRSRLKHPRGRLWLAVTAAIAVPVAAMAIFYGTERQSSLNVTEHQSRPSVTDEYSSPNVTAANRIIATIDVDGVPVGVAVDSSTHAAYVASYSARGQVWVIDTTTNVVTTTIDVDKDPKQVAVDPSSHIAYVTHTPVVSDLARGKVSVIDTVTNAVTATIDIGKKPNGVAIDPNTRTAYVTHPDDDTVSVIDTATNAVTATIHCKDPNEIAVDSDNGAVYVTNSHLGTVSVIDTVTNSLATTIEVGNSPKGVAIDPVANTAYVTSYWDNTVSVVGTVTKTVVATVDVGRDKHPTAVAVDPETHTAYITNFGDNTVSVIDTATKTVVDTLELNDSPGRVAVDTTTHTAYVTNSGRVSVVN